MAIIYEAALQGLPVRTKLKIVHEELDGRDLTGLSDIEMLIDCLVALNNKLEESENHSHHLS